VSAREVVTRVTRKFKTSVSLHVDSMKVLDECTELFKLRSARDANANHSSERLRFHGSVMRVETAS
jgi:hypothetical protein